MFNLGEMAEKLERSIMNLLSKEEQRYGRNKETLVNHTYIESGEYRKKFDNISDNAELNKLLYQLAKKMLIHRSGTLFEDMYWIDPDTLEVVASEISCDVQQKVVYSKSTLKAIRGKKGLITIHSHPHSFPPSIEDFNSNYGHSNGIGVVCGHDGSVYVYWAKEEVQKERSNYLQKKYFNICRDETLAQVRVLNELQTISDIYFEEVTKDEHMGRY